MRRILADALLIAVALAVILTFRGNAQQDPMPVLFAYPFVLECRSGSIQNAIASTGSRGTDIKWRHIDGLNENFNGHFEAWCVAVAIPESAPVPDDAFPDS